MHGHEPCGCEFCQRYDADQMRIARERAVQAATPRLADGTAPGNERNACSECGVSLDFAVNSGSGHPCIKASRAPTSDKPCCRRIATEQWCSRDDGHEGNCAGPPVRAYDESQFYTRVGGGR